MHRPVLLCAQNTLIRRHIDVVDSSSGRSYVTEQWYNVPLLRTRALSYETFNLMVNLYGIEYTIVRSENCEHKYHSYICCLCLSV